MSDSSRYASLASATGTSIDSAAKHNLQCKMYTELIQTWADGYHPGTGAERLKRDKMNFCMHKDEIVLGVRSGWFPDKCFIPPRPYPLVFTTYNGMLDKVEKFLRKLYAQKTMQSVDDYVANVKNRVANHVANAENWAADLVLMTPQFYFQGIALGVAYAHPDSGDTVGTVMYGGLRTILNGPFKAQNGQPCMWIFDFEVAMFDANGKRKEMDASGEQDGEKEIFDFHMKQGDANIAQRTVFNVRQMSALNPHGPEKRLVMVKPYIETGMYPLDKERVFGRYISSGRPFEKIDLHISRLAM